MTCSSSLWAPGRRCFSTAGALARLGIGSTVLERDPEVGARWAERYDRLRLHTIRSFSGLAHHPLRA